MCLYIRDSKPRVAKRDIVVLKYLKRYNPKEHPENEVTNKDYFFLPYRVVELFNCDRIVIDPECYIKIIQQYMERIKKLDDVIQQLKKV